MNKVLAENNKIYLKKLNINDNLSNYLSWINDKDLTLYLNKIKKQNIDDLKNYITYHKDSNNYLCGIYRKNDNTHMGNVLLSHMDNINKNCRIGILVGKN